MVPYSQVPKAVNAWRGELQAKNRPKIAAGIADPTDNPDIFEEGWEKALKQEQNVATTTPVVNGRQC
jgi:coatomer subunit beta'